MDCPIRWIVGVHATLRPPKALIQIEFIRRKRASSGIIMGISADLRTTS